MVARTREQRAPWVYRAADGLLSFSVSQAAKVALVELVLVWVVTLSMSFLFYADVAATNPTRPANHPRLCLVAALAYLVVAVVVAVVAGVAALLLLRAQAVLVVVLVPVVLTVPVYQRVHSPAHSPARSPARSLQHPRSERLLLP